MKMKSMKNLPLKNVKVKDPFWSKIQELIINEVIPYQKAIFEDENPNVERSNAIENF